MKTTNKLKMVNRFKFKKGLKFDTGIWIDNMDPIMMQCKHIMPVSTLILGSAMIVAGVGVMVMSAYINGGYEFDRAQMQLLADLGLVHDKQ